MKLSAILSILKKRGVNLIGLCPFHDERTPSFTVSPAKEIFKCFGCGKAGNTVTFLMEHEKYTYPEALTYLANKYNIEIEETAGSEKYKAENNELESIYIVLSFAQEFYENYLFNSNEGKTLGLAYFKERNFHNDTLKKFNLGFSPPSIDVFTNEALKNGFKEEYLIDAGLTIKTQEGRLIDRFRERVMFPIHSMSGRVLGFGARTLKHGSSEAKYINSPETKVYSKSKVLYGLFQARQAVKKADFCYLVEGYTDLISLYQAGVDNVVASLGTSLTVNHVKIIKRLTNNLTFIFDGDEAGIIASLSKIDIVLEEEVNIRAILLPKNEDPDSFIRNNSKTDAHNYLKNNAKDFILFKTNLFFSDKNLGPIEKSEAIKHLIGNITQIRNNINRNEYIRQLSELTKVDEKSLNRELNNQLRNRVNKLTSSPNVISIKEAGTPHPRQKDILLEVISGEQEKKLLQLLLEYGNKKYKKTYVAEEIIRHLYESEWENPLFKEMFDFFKDYYLENKISPDLNVFLLHPNKYFSEVAAEFINPMQNLSQNWIKRTNINVQMEFDYLREIEYCLKHFDLRKYYSLKKQNLNELKKPDLRRKKVLKYKVLTRNYLIILIKYRVI